LSQRPKIGKRAYGEDGKQREVALKRGNTRAWWGFADVNGLTLCRWCMLADRLGFRQRGL
jgi:hypothetical protein